MCRDLACQFPQFSSALEEANQTFIEATGKQSLADVLYPIPVFSKADEKELINRIMLRGKTSGRTDDQDIEKVNNRIKVYNEETLPVATYFNNQGKLNTIIGVGSVEEIFNSISTVIEKLPQ